MSAAKRVDLIRSPLWTSQRTGERKRKQFRPDSSDVWTSRVDRGENVFTPGASEKKGFRPHSPTFPAKTGVTYSSQMHRERISDKQLSQCKHRTMSESLRKIIAYSRVGRECTVWLTLASGGQWGFQRCLTAGNDHQSAASGCHVLHNRGY